MARGDDTSASMSPSTPLLARLPVIIIGAGISGLLLAQHLRQQGIPFRIFERDADMNSRGVGWGLTLNWSLPMLKSLVSPELLSRLPETYVDRQGIASGVAPRFPFYDLSTGELKATTPPLPETVRVRVTRERLRKWLATDIDVEWNKTFKSFIEASNVCSHSAAIEYQDYGSNAVTVTFDDGSTCHGSLLVACDGSNSRVRRALFPRLAMENLYRLPIAVMGVKMQLSTAQIAGMRACDAYFLQGTSSKDDSFVYMSVLDAPGNSPENPPDMYNLQICLSWLYRDGCLGRGKQVGIPETQEDRRKLFLEFAASYAEPFCSVMGAITNDTEVRSVDLSDWPPPKGLHTTGNVVLMGDSLHPMAMYRGEGANHAIADVADFAKHVVPLLGANNRASSVAGSGSETGQLGSENWPAEKDAEEEGAENGFMLCRNRLRRALDQYEEIVVNRARPGVLASRRACMDAHEWARIGPESPLLTKRQMNIVYDEAADRIMDKA
ncbi:Aromatic-ring hydroxylase-like protein [Metarhizium rileyi]|uniref:Aromatic-ring hydroxylase-like protein n=1 Tax=Metarhizium rileyi (strain RCEF 4871) TaxID=1649241 RepID=A0A162I087_METRR|nr:Aromatic-ring hydroxylase-like protein [Metarhizium rileyi RCEF 4871]